MMYNLKEENLMTNYIKVGKLQVDSVLYEFINQEAIHESGLTSDQFWADLEVLVRDLAPENKRLLTERDELQRKIDIWHKENADTFEFDKYKLFMKEIGYLEPEVEDYQITTEKVDDEITLQAGPQLVVPVNNARYALNAANARWGSLYDALYGTNAISNEDGAEPQMTYNPIRGERVIQFGKEFLDQVAPLNALSHKDAVNYEIVDGQLAVTLNNGETTRLMTASKFIGYQGLPEKPKAILLKNNNLHFEIQIDRSDSIGNTDSAGVKDILLESTLTTIMDCEDAVTAVDAEDKVLVYRNWLGLMKGDLATTFTKGSNTITRALNPDRIYQSGTGEDLTLRGRSLMFVRNVGHLMTSKLY